MAQISQFVKQQPGTSIYNWMSQKAVTDLVQSVRDDIPNDLNGTNYLMVYGTGTPEENAAELQAAYDEAKKMPRFIGFLAPPTPTYIYAGQTFGTYIQDSFKYYKVLVDGLYIPYQMSNSVSVIVTESEAKSVRTTVIVAPGEYNFGASAFIANATGIDIVSLTGNSDVIISSTERNNFYIDNEYTYGIKIIADYVLIKGINCKTNTFYIESYLDNIICEHCKGGDYSFGTSGVASGTFNNCTGGDYSFGTGGILYVVDVGNTVGSNGTASGTFNNCVGGDNSFGTNGIASGTFNNCTGGDYSFGTGGTASGTFNNCIADDTSFGAYYIASGIFNNCKGGDSSFGTYGGIVSGTFNNCVSGNNSFGCYGGVVSGILNNCIGGNNSFGNYGGTITETARLYYICLTSGAFPTPVTGGRLILCIDGDNNIVTI